MITDPEWLTLVLRTLRIDEACWRRLVDGYIAECPDGNESLASRIRVLGQIWRSIAPSEAVLDESFEYVRGCPVCKTDAVTVVAARQQEAASPLVYGSCGVCGLGVLLQGGANSSIYSQPDYYRRRKDAGYDNYLAEHRYRESKGQRLVEWIQKRTGRPLRTFLEIGSGFGYTRAGAEHLGFKTAGVDLNPHAAKTALELYGQNTFTGTLADAVESGAIMTGLHDIVCYQFLLEHLDDPAGELLLAAGALSPNGVLALVVPNMQSLEREIFGASYRSFRRDHLWLFSVESLKLLLDQAGLRAVSIESECNIRLLAGFLSEAELDQLDADCRSADLRIIAEKKYK